MESRTYNPEIIKGYRPKYKGTDEELHQMIDNISLLYSSAIKELQTKLDILSDDFSIKHEYMPIHHIKKRLKTFESLMEKANRYGIEDPINNIDAVLRDVLDIAGIRVICNYEEDMYNISAILLQQSDIELIRIKDYVKNPKESGYRSLHVVVALPVFLVNRDAMVPVEIQFRTIAMDTWASLEHELRYKNKGSLPDDVLALLKDCATQLAKVDDSMNKVRQRVLNNNKELNEYIDL